jgi:hypothetical protein
MENEFITKEAWVAPVLGYLGKGLRFARPALRWGNKLLGGRVGNFMARRAGTRAARQAVSRFGAPVARRMVSRGRFTPALSRYASNPAFGRGLQKGLTTPAGSLQNKIWGGMLGLSVYDTVRDRFGGGDQQMYPEEAYYSPEDYGAAYQDISPEMLPYLMQMGALPQGGGWYPPQMSQPYFQKYSSAKELGEQIAKHLKENK